MDKSAQNILFASKLSALEVLALKALPFLVDYVYEANFATKTYDQCQDVQELIKEIKQHLLNQLSANKRFLESVETCYGKCSRMTVSEGAGAMAVIRQCNAGLNTIKMLNQNKMRGSIRQRAAASQNPQDSLF